MKIVESQVFRGPNIYSLKPVIRFVLDIEDLEDKPSSAIPHFTDRLIEMLPTIHEHRCSEGVAGGFITRLREGTWAGHIVEHVALELQCVIGTPVGYGKCRSAGKPGIYNVIYSYVEEKVGLQAGHASIRIVEHLAHGTPLDFNYELSTLRRILDDSKYGPSTQAIIDKAKERNIPILRLNDQNLVQLGHAKYQKRIEATVTSMTTLIATDIAGNKELTKRLLADAGIPVPKGRIVDEAEAAVRAARDIGFPVVLKPLNANHGKGVAINLKSDEEVNAAYYRASDFSEDVIVEKYIPGRDHRVLVVNGAAVAVAERLPAHVIGDGKHTIFQLVEEENKNPQRGHGHEKALTKIYINEESERCLASQGYTGESIPAAGQLVWLKFTANISTGGTAIDRTDDAHPANVETAIRAARIIGLDVAGVDMITTDIGKPLEETGGAICEVNAGPGFRMHVHPSQGKSRDVAGAVLDMLFPQGTPSRVPIVAITGTNGKTTTARMLAHILKMSGKKVGLTTTDGLYIDGKRILSGDLTGPWSAQMVLREPTVDFAVLETARGGILRAGLGFDRCDIGIITNVTADHLGQRGVETVEELAFVKATVIEVVKRHGHAILNAEDPNSVRIADHTRGELAYFSLDPHNGIFVNHCHEGGSGVTLSGNSVVIMRGDHVLPVIALNDIPAAFNGKAMFNVANAMVAALAAHLSGVSLDDIQTGLRTFDTNFYLSPGRLNLERVGDFSVLMDYAHNPDAYRNLTTFVQKLSAERRIGVLGAPGDRRDVDLHEIAKLITPAFDRIILKEDADLRGRASGAVPEILKRSIVQNGKSAAEVEIVCDEYRAVEAALQQGRKDDLIVITVDDIKRTFEQVVAFRDRRSDAVKV